MTPRARRSTSLTSQYPGDIANETLLTVHCRRKYAKLKIKFEQAMRQSNALVKEELRIIDLAKRLKEQNEYVLR